MAYLRWRAPAPNRRGFHPGIFALVNGLSAAGELTAAEERFRVAGNAWFHAHLTDPATVDPTVYDRTRHPGAAAWFRPTATRFLARIPGYLEILDAHGVAWELVRSADPGRIVYADADQVLAVPVAAG